MKEEPFCLLLLYIKCKVRRCVTVKIFVGFYNIWLTVWSCASQTDLSSLLSWRKLYSYIVRLFQSYYSTVCTKLLCTSGWRREIDAQMQEAQKYKSQSSLASLTCCLSNHLVTVNYSTSMQSSIIVSLLDSSQNVTTLYWKAQEWLLVELPTTSQSNTLCGLLLWTKGVRTNIKDIANVL